MRPRPLTWLLIALALAAGLTVAAAGCGSGKDDSKSRTSARTTPPPDYDGAVATPPKPAPPLQLTDSTGRPYDIAAQHGKVVLVTFLYTHCPDVCPLIVSNLKIAQRQLGTRAAKLSIVAVSTDPRGDTPKAVNAFLRDHGMTGRMRYLVGSKLELGRTWTNWGVSASPDASNPELVEHSAQIYGVGASGKITTLYPANFRPAQIVHDVPLLAQN